MVDHPVSEASAAQAYFDPPDPPEYCWECGYEPCECDDDELVGGPIGSAYVFAYEEEPPELEDYMMRKRGLIE